MTSLEKRKQKVNELRKAHFPFGFQDNKAVTSEYKKVYQEYPLSRPEAISNKGNNFSIGSDEPQMAKNTYQSQFKQQFPGYNVQPPQPVKGNNEGNNIVMGFDSTGQQTNYQQDFVGGQADRGKQINQRLVSVQLGDTLTDFTTSYNKAFDGSQAPPTEQVNNNLRQANLVFGFGQNGYQTSSGAAHNSKPVASSKPVERTYGTNVVFGGDAGNYHSEQKTQFPHKDSGYKAVDKDRVLDFKKAHFQMGYPEAQQENLSEAQAHYNAKPLTKVEVQGRKPTNIALKHDDQNYFTSSYGDHFTDKGIQKPQLLNKNGRQDNVVIGMGNQTYTSQAKDQFIARPINVVKGKGTEGSLQLGDGTVDFSTQYQHTYTDKSGKPYKVSAQDVKKMRVQNYVTGFSGPDYKLHSMSYGQGRGETNKLNRQTIDKMRNTNIINGGNVFEGKSIQTSSYGWKKNNDF